MSKFKHCGRGVCAAEAGHKGTCAQASGWDEFTADVADRAYESGLADGRAEAVAEEPEWEYGFQLRESDSGDVYDQEVGFDTEQDATDEGNKRIHDEDDDEYPPLALRLIRRAKSGPWVPVKQEGAETDA